jgi:hypothetical protein
VDIEMRYPGIDDIRRNTLLGNQPNIVYPTPSC